MTTAIMEEIRQTIAILEASLPANVNTPENQRLQKLLENDLIDYFDSLARAFPYHRLDAIYNRYVVREAVGEEAEALIDPLLANFTADFTKMLNGHLVTIYLAGSAQMISWGTTKVGIPLTYEGPPIQQAVDYAEKHISKAKLIDRDWETS